MEGKIEQTDETPQAQQEANSETKEKDEILKTSILNFYYYLKGEAKLLADSLENERPDTAWFNEQGARTEEAKELLKKLLEKVPEVKDLEKEDENKKERAISEEVQKLDWYIEKDNLTPYKLGEKIKEINIGLDRANIWMLPTKEQLSFALKNQANLEKNRLYYCKSNCYTTIAIQLGDNGNIDTYNEWELANRHEDEMKIWLALVRPKQNS